MKKSLLTLLSFILIGVSMSFANTVTIPNPGSGISLESTGSTYLPIAINTNTTKTSCAYHSVSQQLYYASELGGASSTTIEAITFYYEDGTCFDGDYARKLQVWMNETSITDFDTENSNTPHMVNPGTKVFSGSVEIISDKSDGWNGKPYTITFDTPFEWDGTSNIIVTVQDTTGTRNTSSTFGGVGNTDRTVAAGHTSMFADEGKVRFLHKTCTTAVASESKGWDITSLSTAQAINMSAANRKYVNKITFTFAAAAAVVPAPTSPHVDNEDIDNNSAVIRWTAAAGVDSYEIQYGTNSGSLDLTVTGITDTYRALSGLEEGTMYYYQVRAKKGSQYSQWVPLLPNSFTTKSTPISYKDIDFYKWNSTNSLPSETGNYYLANNVELAANCTISGNLNLCLNGHTIYTVTNRIIVDGGATLTLYNNESEGLIYGGVETSMAEGGVIDVEVDGTLIIPEGRIENIADASYGSYAVLSSGTLKISGSPELIGESASIYLYGSGKVITIEEGKPLTNTTPYAVNSTGQTITSGWANMSGANPCRFFTSAKPNYSAVVVESNEVKLVQANLKLVDSSDNDTKISEHQGDVSVLAMTRSLTSAQYNTFCLPFALTDAQLEEYFGVGYDLEEFVSSSLEGDVLSLEFSKVTSLEAGKPYLLKPDWDIINPTFENVTISVEDPVDQTSDANISFHGTFSPTELTGGDKNTLFLGAGNELFYPSTTANIKAFRAYFEVKGDARKAAKRARIVKKEDAATGVDQITNDKLPMTNKILRNGEILILRDGKTYNVLGMECK